ncbi:unnamed protein product [Camellia sinensis]
MTYQGIAYAEIKALREDQHYAKDGLKTCLVIQSQDPIADYLLHYKVGTSPITCNNNLSAVRLETTKMLLEPLNQLKQVDACLNMTQGVLEWVVVGEELGVLPGMDSIFPALALQRLVGFSGNVAQRNQQKDKFDVIVYNGISTEETIRIIGTTSKTGLYLKHFRNLAEKADLGRLALTDDIEVITSSVLGNLLDVVEEVQVARVELQNLTYSSFCPPSVEQLELHLHFIDFSSGRKVA